LLLKHAFALNCPSLRGRTIYDAFAVALRQGGVSRQRQRRILTYRRWRIRNYAHYVYISCATNEL
jgi:hypothetical protein